MSCHFYVTPCTEQYNKCQYISILLNTYTRHFFFGYLTRKRDWILEFVIIISTNNNNKRSWKKIRLWLDCNKDLPIFSSVFGWVKQNRSLLPRLSIEESLFTATKVSFVLIRQNTCCLDNSSESNNFLKSFFDINKIDVWKTYRWHSIVFLSYLSGIH